MQDASFVAGDWGTSHLRLFLCAEDGAVLEHAEGPGAAAATGRFAEVLAGLSAPWRRRQPSLPTVLSGMVGSSIGWAQTAYVPCPATSAQIAGACLPLLEGSVHIVPGLSCRNRVGAPDLMRGEETQILGALRADPTLRRGRHLLCLPGTHTKWALLSEGAVSEFLSAPTGEVFAVLREHSVLVSDRADGHRADGDVAYDDCTFKQALAQFNRHADAQLLHHLFECRSRRLALELTPQAAASYLSGLLIASDVSGALHLLAGSADSRSVRLIGAPRLTAAYAAALAALDCSASVMDGSSAALGGLTQLQRLLRQPVAHAES